MAADIGTVTQTHASQSIKKFRSVEVESNC